MDAYTLMGNIIYYRQDNLSAKVVGYRSDWSDYMMYLRWCDNFTPVPYDEWYTCTCEYMSGDRKCGPYIGQWPSESEIQASIQEALPMDCRE